MYCESVIYRFKVTYENGKTDVLYVDAICEMKAEQKLKDLLALRERIGACPFTWEKPDVFLEKVIC